MRPGLPRLPLQTLLLGGALAAFGLACAGGPKPAPEWIAHPPAHTSRHLYFVGEATDAPTEGRARELALQAAIVALVQHCGATVTADFVVEQREENGVFESMVSQRVQVSNQEMSLREAVVEESLAQEGRRGFDGFVRLRWPRAQYAAVLDAQRKTNHRALALYLEAESALDAAKVRLARTRIGESRAVLGAHPVRMPLSHERVSSVDLLVSALDTLEQRTLALAAARRRMVAVGVECRERGARVQCPSHRIGHVRQRVVKAGLEVSANALPSALVQSIAASASPQIQTDIRDSGWVLAVVYDADLLGTDGDFTFASCGARGVVYDTEGGQIVGLTEVKAQKGGHLHFAGAVEKGCTHAEGLVLTWLDGAMSELDGHARTSHAALDARP